MAYNVLICDDQIISRQLFESIIEGSEKYSLVASIPSAKFADVYCASGNVDLVLMDIVMKDGYSGLDAAGEMKKKYPDVKIIIVTSMPDCSFIERARQAKADSFWYKEIQDIPMLEIMDRTMAGESIYPDSVPVVSIGDATNTDLSERELEVLRILSAGASNNEIADRLSISLPTVRTHISRLMEKTGLSSRTELAIHAMKSGIIVPD